MRKRDAVLLLLPADARQTPIDKPQRYKYSHLLASLQNVATPRWGLCKEPVILGMPRDCTTKRSGRVGGSAPWLSEKWYLRTHSMTYSKLGRRRFA
jgi:hypothetical protein